MRVHHVMERRQNYPLKSIIPDCAHDQLPALQSLGLSFHICKSEQNRRTLSTISVVSL